MAYIMPFGRSDVRRRVLESFLVHKTPEIHVRELARRLDCSAPAVGKELAALERIGLLKSRMVGRTRVYWLDSASPIARSTSDLYQKTIGVEAGLRNVLASLPGLESAWIFGSYASGADRPGSDIDVLVIGTMHRRELMSRLAEAEQALGREVNIMAVTTDQWEARQGRGLIQDISSKPIIPLISAPGAIRP